ncbi:MAG: shikimate kinase [Acidiferrobacterales bacterium]
MVCSVFLIGPSGVGKTALGEHIPGLMNDWGFVDLDELVSRAHQGTPARDLLGQFGSSQKFLEACMEIYRLHVMSNSSGRYVVAVGAGCLDSNSVRERFLPERTIAIMATKDEAYRRFQAARSDGRSQEEYMNSEFSSERNALYAWAAYMLDTTDTTLERAAQELAELVHILNNQ